MSKIRKIGKNPKVITRKKPPLIDMSGKTPTAMCPFCEKPHPISSEKLSPCGAFIEFTTVQKQVDLRGHMVVCMRCGKSGGTFVKHSTGYLHTGDCAGNVDILTGVPNIPKWESFWAGIAFFSPPWLYKIIYAIVKKEPRRIQDIDEKTGQSIGEVHGYLWSKSDERSSSG